MAKDDPMDRRKFLVVGGGLAAESAVQAIRENGEGLRFSSYRTKPIRRMTDHLCRRVSGGDRLSTRSGGRSTRRLQNSVLVRKSSLSIQSARQRRAPLAMSSATTSFCWRPADRGR